MRGSRIRRIAIGLLVAFVVSYVLLPQVAVAQSTPYQRIQQALASLEDEVRLGEFELSSAEVFKLRNEAIYSDPYVVYFDYNRSVYWSDGRLEFVYSKPKAEVSKAQAALRAAVNTIVTEVTNPTQSDLEKLVALHEFVVQNSRYERTISGAPQEFAHSAYGVLLYGQGVCSSYALALKALLDAVGIESWVVSGIAKGEAHAWNLVKLAGQYYHLDATWNDPVPDSPGRVRYSFFLLTDEQIGATHSWTETLPSADSTRYSHLNGMDEAVRVGPWFYYRDMGSEEIYRIKIDGSSKDLLAGDRSAYLATDGTWIYYSNLSNGGYIYRMALDGSQKTLFHKESAKNLSLREGWLHFQGWEDNVHYRLDPVTVAKQLVTQELSLGTRSLTLTPNGQFSFTFPNVAAASFVWSSSNESVAKVDGGVITARKPGGAVITVTGPDGSTDSCLVLVVLQSTEVILTVGRREALVNGTQIILPVSPYLKASVGRTLVPVRFVSEALGAKVLWVDSTKQVVITQPGIEIVLTIGSAKAYVNGVLQTLDCPAEITGNTTFVPLRFVSETLGAKVTYNESLKRISILN